jgi:hypothetical protein
LGRGKGKEERSAVSDQLSAVSPEAESRNITAQFRHCERGGYALVTGLRVWQSLLHVWLRMTADMPSFHKKTNDYAVKMNF